MGNAEDRGTFSGADEFRDKMKKGLIDASKGGAFANRPSSSARAGAGNPQARKDFMGEFEQLCAKYGVRDIDFVAFVKSSLMRVL